MGEGVTELQLSVEINLFTSSEKEAVIENFMDEGLRFWLTILA